MRNLNDNTFPHYSQFLSPQKARTPVTKLAAYIVYFKVEINQAKIQRNLA